MTRLGEVDGAQLARLRDAMWQFDPLALVAQRHEIEQEYDALLFQILDAIRAETSPDVINLTIAEAVMIDWLGLDTRESQSMIASDLLAEVASLQRAIRAIWPN